MVYVDNKISQFKKLNPEVVNILEKLYFYIVDIYKKNLTFELWTCTEKLYPKNVEICGKKLYPEVIDIYRKTVP